MVSQERRFRKKTRGESVLRFEREILQYLAERVGWGRGGDSEEGGLSTRIGEVFLYLGTIGTTRIHIDVHLVKSCITSIINKWYIFWSFPFNQLHIFMNHFMIT